MLSLPWRKKTSIPIKKGKKIKDDYHDFINDDRLDNNDEFDDDDDFDITKRIEIVVKDSHLRIKDIEAQLRPIYDSFLSTIHSLKKEISELKEELKEEKVYNRHLIDKLVDKPSPPSAAALHIASRAAEAARTGTSVSAGPKGKLP